MSPSSLDSSDQAASSQAPASESGSEGHSTVAQMGLDGLKQCLQRWVNACFAEAVLPDDPVFSSEQGFLTGWLAGLSQLLPGDWVAIALPSPRAGTALTPMTAITVQSLALAGVLQPDKTIALVRALKLWCSTEASLGLQVSDLQQLQIHLPGTIWPISINAGQPDAWLLACPTTLVNGKPGDLGDPDRSGLIQQVVRDYAIAAQQVRQICRYRQRLHHLEQENRELRQANQIKSEFLANTSHEIRTPLSSILGFTHLLKAQGYNPINMRHQEYLNIILSSGQHLLALINDILDLSKIEANQLSLNWEALDVADICQMALKLVKEKASDKGLKLELELAPDIACLTGDSLRLKQMLFNLLSNALKFTRRGAVGLRVSIAEGWMRFAVWDTGIGIPEEQQRLLFVPYSQLDGSLQTEGTGLGLALTQKLAELHGGWVEVQSTLGHGSCFTIVLPEVTPALDPETHTALRPDPGVADGQTLVENFAPSDSSDSQSAARVVIRSDLPVENLTLPNRILLVEDHPNNAKLLLTYLSKLGYEVSWAKHADNMWSELARAKPTLILMDINLPDVDGLTLTRQLREDPRYAEIPIVAQTAMAMKGDRDICIEAGASDYISKPIDLDALAHLVRQYV